MLESINRCHTEAGPFVTGLAILFYFYWWRSAVWDRQKP